MRRIRGHVHDQLRRVRHARHRHLRRLCRHVPVRSTSGGSRGARPRHCPYGEAARSGRPRPTAPTRRPLSRLTASAGYRARVHTPTSSLTKGALAAGHAAGLDAVGVAPARPFTPRSRCTRVPKGRWAPRWHGVHVQEPRPIHRPWGRTRRCALDRRRSTVVRRSLPTCAVEPPARDGRPLHAGATTTDSSPKGSAPSPPA